MVRGRAGVLVLFFISLILIAAYYFLHSPFFGVSQVTVKGISLVGEEEIIRLSGIRSGENLWRLDTQRVKQQLLFHPQVEDVEIRREWPSEVLLEIKERKPIAVVSQGSSFILIDQRGIFLRKVDSIHGIPLPMITGLPIPVNIGPGQAIEVDGLASALQVCMELNSSVLLRIGEINVASGNRLVLYSGDGIEIRFGTPDDISQKGEVLKDILGEVARNGSAKKIQYIDISSVKSPVIKPREEGSGKRSGTATKPNPNPTPKPSSVGKPNTTAGSAGGDIH